ncbi:MAG: septation protein A, partial [Burkholderiaceae bacterium]
IGLSVLFIALMRIKGQAIDRMQWISLALIVVFGGATLVLHDEQFIKLKPTILYGAFCLVFLLPQLLGKALVIEKMLGQKVELPGSVWQRLNTAWAIFFAGMAVLNWWVAQAFSTDTWVNFKLFGGIGLTLAFVLAQGVYMSRHVKETQQ